MIEDENQLRYSIEWIAKFYATSDREANTAVWDADTRRETAEETNCMRRKIEREVAEFLAKKYGYEKPQAVQESSVPKVETPTEIAA